MLPDISFGKIGQLIITFSTAPVDTAQHLQGRPIEPCKELSMAPKHPVCILPNEVSPKQQAQNLNFALTYVQEETEPVNDRDPLQLTCCQLCARNAVLGSVKVALTL